VSTNTALPTARGSADGCHGRPSITEPAAIGRALLEQAAAHEQEAVRLRHVGARRRDDAVVRRVAAVERDHVARVEHHAAGAEDEVDVAADLAAAHVRAAGLGEEGVLVPGEAHVVEHGAVGALGEGEGDPLRAGDLRGVGVRLARVPLVVERVLDGEAGEAHVAVDDAHRPAVARAEGAAAAARRAAASSHVTTVLSRPAPTSHTLGLSTETFSR
jgi:hypothetical protein